MKEYRTKAIINAPAAIVFKIITDASCHPIFDPNCIKIEGAMKQGKYLKLYSKLSPKRIAKVRVREIKPNELMVWENGLPFNLWRNVRTFTVIAKDDYTTEFHMVEVLSGPLLTWIEKWTPDLTDSFTQFSKGLKNISSHDRKEYYLYRMGVVA